MHGVGALGAGGFATAKDKVYGNINDTIRRISERLRILHILSGAGADVLRRGGIVVRGA